MALTLRTDPELERALDALVELSGGSRQDVIRQAILETWRRADRRQQLDVVLDEELNRYQDALDRLGQ